MVIIGTTEMYRALLGWKTPSFGSVATGNLLKDNYFPGDIGFDPLSLKPQNALDFENIEAKELNNGRLAMVAISGMVAQELVDRKPILS